IVDVDTFDLGELKQLVYRLLASYAGKLVAAKGGAGKMKSRAIDGYASGFQFNGRTVSIMQTAGIYGGRQAVVQSIDFTIHFFDVAPFDDGHHRAEDFLACDGHR